MTTVASVVPTALPAATAHHTQAHTLALTATLAPTNTPQPIPTATDMPTVEQVAIVQNNVPSPTHTPADTSNAQVASASSASSGDTENDQKGGIGGYMFFAVLTLGLMVKFVLLQTRKRRVL